MAKQVSEILVKLGIQGFEGLDRLKSSFRGLEKAIGPSDSAIQTARQSIIDFAGSGKQSIQVIQGQIEAFKGLQSQATIGGNVYRQLAGDVNRLSDTLKQLKNDYEEVGRAARQTDAQIAAQFPARRPEAFRQQIAVLNRQLDQLSVSARAYGDALTEITIRETAFGRAQGRQRVIAGAQAVGAPLIGAMQPQQPLPNTTAALQLRVSELQSDLDNLDRSSEDYLNTARQISDLQEELSRNILGTAASYDRLAAAENASIRRAEKLRGIQEYFRTQGPLAPGVGGFRDPATGAMIAAGTRAGRQEVPIERPMREISGLFQQIGQIGMQPIAGDIEMMGNSYSAVADDIKRATAASNGSIQSLNAQRNAWQTLRAQIDPTSADFREASKEIEQLDRRLGKLQQTQSRRMGGMQMAQAAGAAISGGIFGGPEGFLGGAIGGIAGGVGGAFVGAAAGAQVGMLRQQLGGFADYAAQIQKMEIALRNAAGSQDQFNQAMAAASAATRNLNVPQDVAIQGMTKLTAAVKGAGGQVSDAEIVFNNVTAAIKATGGSAQDVDGAITAMVQVFSKGKVSAEELSGQLGERLPGAVTKFAEANQMTLPELQKALEQGQVGLNELMNFIVQLGDEYAGVAGQIAGSSQDAGARLTVAFNQMRIAVGEALQPIGAQMQETFAQFITNITPALVSVLPKIGELMLVIAKNFDTAAVAVGAFMAVLAVSKISAFISGAGGLIAALVSIASAATGAASSMTALAFASAAVPWVALAAGAAAAAGAIYKASTAQQEFNDKIYQAPLVDVQIEIQKLQSELSSAEQRLQTTVMQFGQLSQEAAFAQAKVDGLRAALGQATGDYKIRLLYEQVGVKPDSRYLGPGFAAPPGTQKPTKFPTFDTAGSKAGAKAKKERESQLPQLMAELALQEQLAGINAKIRQAQLAENNLLEIRLEGEKELAQIAKDIRDISFEKIPADEAEVKRKILLVKAEEARLNIAQKLAIANDQFVKETLSAGNELKKSYEAQVSERNRLEELTSTGMTEALAKEYVQIENLMALEKERFEKQIERLKAIAALGGPGAKEAQAKIGLLQGSIEGLGGREAELKGLAGAAQPSQLSKIQEFIKQAELELRDLEAMSIRIAENIGNAIGNSIANGITSLIEGTATLKEVFAGLLKDIGQILIQESTKMIATYIAIGIARAFAGLGGSSIVQGKNVPLSALPPGMAFADGAAFAKNGIQPFANGGIVTKPTFFKYADGGTGRFGLMGEAGPEAIMPLKRGLDGKLGVAARMDGAMKRYRPVPGGAEAATEAAMGTQAGGAPGSASIDVRYTVERINSVDYVTADQFQAGLQQAAAQGAERGQQLALRRLQQSPSTRRRVGI